MGESEPRFLRYYRRILFFFCRMSPPFLRRVQGRDIHKVVVDRMKSSSSHPSKALLAYIHHVDIVAPPGRFDRDFGRCDLELLVFVKLTCSYIHSNKRSSSIPPYIVPDRDSIDFKNCRTTEKGVSLHAAAGKGFSGGEDSI